MGKQKFTAEKKVEMIEAFLSGKVSKSQLGEVYGMYPSKIYRWLSKYEANSLSRLSARRSVRAA